MEVLKFKISAKPKMRHRLISVFLGGCVAAMLVVSLPAQQSPAVEIRTTKLCDGLSVLEGGGANVGVSVGHDGVLMVDSGIRGAVDKVREAVVALDRRPPRIVLDTNWHYDHADGNETMAALGAAVVAHRRSRSHMLAEQKITEMNPPLMVPAYPRGALPVITLDEPATIHFNDEIDVIHVPAAHSDGDLAYYFRNANVLFTGDLFFPAGTLFIHYGGGGTLRGMIRAADRFATLVNDDTRIVPGHGPVCRRSDVLKAKTSLVEMRDRLEALIAKGYSVTDVAKADPLVDLFSGRPNPSSAGWARLMYLELAQKR